MNEALRELYQELIIDHGRHPRNHCTMGAATHRLEGFNPLCGDKMTLFLKIENDVISAASFTGEGCAISMASASLMTECLKGKKTEDAHQLFELFHRTVTDNDCDTDLDKLGKLAVLTGVKAFPTRVKCATLAWHTLEGCLQGASQPVTTE